MSDCLDYYHSMSGFRNNAPFFAWFNITSMENASFKSDRF
jgi:hypothetical protein